MGVGIRLKGILRDRKMTIKKLAESADIPVNTLYSITKRDSERVDPVIVQRIADTLHVSPDVLTGQSETGMDISRASPAGTDFSFEGAEDLLNALSFSQVEGEDGSIYYIYKIAGKDFNDTMRLNKLFTSIVDNPDKTPAERDAIMQRMVELTSNFDKSQVRPLLDFIDMIGGIDQLEELAANNETDVERQDN